MNIFLIFSVLYCSYKIEEEVISSEKIYEGSTLVRALNEGFSDIGITF